MPKKFLYGALLVLLVFAAVLGATAAGWFEAPENIYYDTWHQLAGRRYRPARVVLVIIDDQTRLAHLDEPLAFWGPHFARAIEVLRQAGVQVIGLDYLFSVSPESWIKRLNLPESEKSRTYDLPLREQLASGRVVLPGNLVIDDRGKSQVLLPLPDYWASLPGKLDDVGLVNFFNDPDGVIRRFISALPGEKGEEWLAFAPLLAMRANPGRALMNPPAGRYISFAGPPGTFLRLPLQRLLEVGAERDPEIASLKDKVVIIGADFSGQQDAVLTPYARGFLGAAPRLMTGAELHANIVETMLSDRVPRPVPTLLRWVYLLAILAAGTVLFFRLSPLKGLVAAALLGVSAALAAYLLFLSDWILPTSSLQAGLLLCYLGTLGFRLTGEEQERRRLRQIFGRYVADEVLDKLLSSGKLPDLGGEALQVTVLFADIRNFTTLSEQLGPTEVVEILNTFFSQACDPILAEGGTVDKYIGDAIMAVFGAPAKHPDHARRALRAALALARLPQDLRAWLGSRFAGLTLPEFRIGIGLHTGEAVVGNIGSPKRLEYTAIGDTVNIASRLQGATKELGWTIAASREVVAAVGPGVVVGRREKRHLRGRQQEVEAVEVLGLEETESPTVEKPAR